MGFRIFSAAIILGLAVVLPFGSSCNQSTPISGDPPPIIDSHNVHDHGEGGHDHAHDHGHDHAHGHSHADLGPNGGHILELGDEQFHAEWKHDDDTGKLTVFILDGNAKELVPITAEKVTIEKTLAERTDAYDLAPVDRQGEPAKTAKFEIVDKALVAALKMVGDGVEASLKVDVEGKPFTVKFTKHEDHHGHKH